MGKKSTKEEKYCFVGDVEKFCIHYSQGLPWARRIPADIVFCIFYLRWSRETARYKSWRQMALNMRIRIDQGEHIPRKLRDHKEIAKVAEDIMSNYLKRQEERENGECNKGAVIGIPHF